MNQSSLAGDGNFLNRQLLPGKQYAVFALAVAAHQLVCGIPIKLCDMAAILAKAGCGNDVKCDFGIFRNGSSADVVPVLLSNIFHEISHGSYTQSHTNDFCRPVLFGIAQGNL